jgi:hypothetical protein
MAMVAGRAMWQAGLGESGYGRRHALAWMMRPPLPLPLVTVDTAVPLNGAHGPVPQRREIDGAPVRASGRSPAAWSAPAAGHCDDLSAAGRS